MYKIIITKDDLNDFGFNPNNGEDILYISDKIIKSGFYKRNSYYMYDGGLSSKILDNIELSQYSGWISIEFNNDSKKI